jgi:DNA-binding transcriptional ArsR family regulator
MKTEPEAIGRLAALAHEARLRAFRLLVKAGTEGMASGEIADALDIPPTAMSFHLAALERSGLVTSRREGRRIVYALEFDNVRELLTFLTDDCCDGRPELCGIKPKIKTKSKEPV